MPNLLLIILAYLILAVPAAAGEPVDLGEVVVREKREVEPAADVSGFVTIIEAKDIPSQVTSIPEVLDQAVGVNVKQYGGLGGFSTISIRGSSSQQVVIYLDGILLNRAVSGVVNIADIPIDNVERIEIYRGSSPARFGTSAIGGVVNIITKKATRRDFNVNYSFGSFKTHKVNLFASQRLNRLDYVLFFNRSQSRGDFRFKDDKATPYTREDDEWTHRRNNAFHSEDLLIKTGYDLPSGYRIDLQNNLFNKRQGIPGIANFQSRDARLRTLRNLSHLRLSKNGFIFPSLNAELLLSYSFQRQQFRDLKGEIGIGKQNNRDDTHCMGAQLMFSFLIGEHQNITLLGEVFRETFRSSDRLADLSDDDYTTRVGHLYGFTESAVQRVKRSTDKQKRDSFALSLEDEIYFFNGRVIINPSLKFNRYENRFSGRVPFSMLPIAPESSRTEQHLTRKVGAVITLTEAVSIRGNIGKYYRMPAFYELFGDRGAIIGNTALKPEKGLNWDMGMTLQYRGGRILKSFLFEYAFFKSQMDDLILFIQNSQRTSIAMNISKALITGHEFFWRMELPFYLRISGNFTIQDAEDRSRVAYWRGNRLPGRPKYQVFNRIEFHRAQFRLFYEIDFMGENYLNRANSEKINRRTFQNVGLSVTPQQWVTVTFEVKNMTNQYSYDVIGYPLPGRSMFCTVDFRF